MNEEYQPNTNENTAPDTSSSGSSAQSVEVLFSAEEARVLGSLMEKQLTTPKSYPLTINSIMLACNQKTNREPVMSMTEGDVGHTVQKLSERGYVAIEYGERANKVFQKAQSQFSIKREGQAVLAILMLRAPMTLSDIKARTERMVEFSDNEAVAAVLQDLMERDRPLVKLLPKGSGRREDRYTHLLCGDVEVPSKSATNHRPLPTSDVQQQLDVLRRRIELLESRLDMDDE